MENDRKMGNIYRKMGNIKPFYGEFPHIHKKFRIYNLTVSYFTVRGKIYVASQLADN
jgi:hypothetical protein